MTGELPLCPGGRCSQLLVGVAQWRRDFAASAAERAGDLMAQVFTASLNDADVPWDVRRRIEQAFDARMSRFAEGLDDVPAR